MLLNRRSQSYEDLRFENSNVGANKKRDYVRLRKRISMGIAPRYPGNIRIELRAPGLTAVSPKSVATEILIPPTVAQTPAFTIRVTG